MPYKFLEHTADIRMEVEAQSLKEVFESAFLGVMYYLGGENPKLNGQVKRLINISAVDRTNLLIDFLNEVLASAQIHKEIYTEVKFNFFPGENDTGELFLEAEILGGEAESFLKDIKAITYHEANLVKDEKRGWSIIIVFDI
jgi:SHS2 domain-containing protein